MPPRLAQISKKIAAWVTPFIGVLTAYHKKTKLSRKYFPGIPPRVLTKNKNCIIILKAAVLLRN